MTTSVTAMFWITIATLGYVLCGLPLIVMLWRFCYLRLSHFEKRDAFSRIFVISHLISFLLCVIIFPGLATTVIQLAGYPFAKDFFLKDIPLRLATTIIVWLVLASGMWTFLIPSDKTPQV